MGVKEHAMTHDEESIDKIERLEGIIDDQRCIINTQALEIRRLREQLISEQGENDNLLYLHSSDRD